MSAKEKRRASRDGKKEYTNLAEKAEQGDYSDLIDPLDFIILDLLPDEGKMFGGVYPEGKTANNIVDERFKGIIDPPKVAVRLRLMRELRLTMNVKSLVGARESAWQKTKKGKEVVAEWQRRQPEAKAE